MENTFKTTQARYTGLKILVDFQFKALGFRTCGKNVFDVLDGYETTMNCDDSGKITANTKEKRHIEKYAYYRRHSAYPTNILLELVRFFLFIVRIIRKLSVVALPLVIVFALLGTDIAQEPLFYVLSAYCLTWLATIGLSILAVIIRAAFRMDERMDEICLSYGWQPYSSYRNS